MDNPTWGKKAVEASGARPTEAGGEELFGSIMPFLEKFSREYREKYAERAWHSSLYAWHRQVYADGRWRQPIKMWMREEPPQEAEQAEKLPTG